MRYLLALPLFALLLSGLLSGCATDAEDRIFFNDGWMHPEEGAERRLMDPGAHGGQTTPEPEVVPDRPREGR